jgi:carbon-monoxide dehydrogenase large subunit
MTAPYVGRPVRRLEDPRLITGQGKFVDDLAPPGLLHAAFVRSFEAHARIEDIDIDDAVASPGVVGVFTAADLGVERPMLNSYPAPFLVDSVQAPPLASDEVCYVGEPIAVVVAETKEQAVDAAGMVFVTLGSLPVIVDHERALDEGAPPAHAHLSDNLVTRLAASFGDMDAAMSEASTVVELTLRQHRGIVASMEPRGVVAHDDPSVGELVVWSSTQAPHPLRTKLSRYLDIPLHEIRVIAPDVGGGFGPKAGVYAEEYVVAALARRLGRPVKWIESRREHFTTTYQQRDQTYHMEAAVTSTGRILGLKARVAHDNGAYVPYGVVLPMTGLQLMNGPYALDALDVAIDVVYTNKPPTTPIRGAGRPYAVFAVERLVDAVADELGLDRTEVRRTNFIQPEDFPYELGLTARTGKPVTYDSGDYETALDMALRAADVDGFAARKEASRAQGKLRGLGLASYVEDTGLGPFEGARVEVMPSGQILVETAAASQGQGHDTIFAQICADQLGVDLNEVVVRSADTSVYGHGLSTVASRTAITAGSSVHLAATEVAAMVRDLAAEHLEARSEDLVLADGRASVVGQPDVFVTLADLSQSMQGTAATPLPGGRTNPGLSADAAFQITGPAFTFGTHVAEVEVDPETGFVDVVTYTVAHDCGTLLNPMIVDGQIDGGVAHGLGNALLERLAYDESGQPLVTTFVDYRIMSAASMPELRKVHSITPAPGNPLGVKGAGEGGTIPAAPAIASAVDDALREYGVFVDRHPVTPETVFEMIKAATTS